MSIYLGRVKETNLYLSLAGTSALNVAFASVTVKYRKFGQTAFTTKVLNSLNWIEVGFGYYVLKWAPSDLDTLGTFMFTVSGAGFDNFKYGEFDVDPVPLPLFVPVDTCIVSGNIRDLGGNPGQNQLVLVRGSDFPMKSGNTLLSSDLIRTSPDYYGNFSLPLVQGKTVLIEIERVGIRNQIIVPSQPTANLLDLLPLIST